MDTASSRLDIAIAELFTDYRRGCAERQSLGPKGVAEIMISSALEAADPRALTVPTGLSEHRRRPRRKMRFRRTYIHSFGGGSCSEFLRRMISRGLFWAHAPRTEPS